MKEKEYKRKWGREIPIAEETKREREIGEQIEERDGIKVEREKERDIGTNWKEGEIEKRKGEKLREREIGERIGMRKRGEEMRGRPKHNIEHCVLFCYWENFMITLFLFTVETHSFGQ